jgi:hypothetical protein
MRHSRQDAIDTGARRRSTQSPVWHPVLAAMESEPGQWIMIDTTNKRYGLIRLLRIGGEWGYRSVTWAERSEDRRLIGYFTSLRAAAEAAHGDFLREHGRSLG